MLLPGGVGCQSVFFLLVPRAAVLGLLPRRGMSSVCPWVQSCLIVRLFGPQETEDAPAASQVERSKEREAGVQREVLCPLPAPAGASAEPGRRVQWLQPPRVLRVPSIPEEDPGLEVHRVLRGQVSLPGRPRPPSDSALEMVPDKLPTKRVSLLKFNW